jgi:YVTN family beta-propeller protein
MIVRRVGWLAAMVLPILVWMACGQVYRPVVIPCSVGGVPGCPVETNPAPSNFHEVFAISTNAPNYPGGAMQIDVSGDSIIGETPSYDASKPNLGGNPTHAVILPNDSRVFVASAASVVSGGVDVISSFTPMFQTPQATGLGTVNTIGLPPLSGQSSGISALSEMGNVVTVTLTTPLLANPQNNVLVGTAVVIAGAAVAGYNGTFAITGISATTLQYTDPTINLTACSPTPPAVPCAPGGTASIPGQPVYLASIENTAMYVANFNSNSVAKINTTTNVVINTANLEPPSPASVSPAPNPVSMAEAQTLGALKLYVANQGNNTVSSLNSVDLSASTVTGFTGVTPVWVVARGDGQKVYVLTQGDGQLVTIDTATDTVTSSLPVGIGANFIFFDPNLNRLYVTNPITEMVYVFSDTGGLSNGVVSDIPNQLAAIPFTAGSVACPLAGCMPVSVTALLDGSRFYVANYQTATTCPDTNVTGACVIPGLTIFDANTFAVKYPSAPTLTLLSSVPFATGQYALPPVAACATAPLYPALYSPSVPRFRVFTVAAFDSSRVYVSMCDAGAIAVINTTGGNTNNSGSPLPADTVITDLLEAPEANSATALQSPIFLFIGQ